VTSLAQSLLVNGVTMRFILAAGPLTALEDINLSLEAREFGAIIGPSGCGKSTLLRLIADILRPTSGSIDIAGQHPEVARRNHQIGFVFQAPTLLPWRTVRDNVRLPADVAGSKRSALSADDLIKLVGLAGFEQALPAELSGGMQQRVAIARALLLKPAILLLDEPFGALDEITRQRMNGELLRIWSETHTTALLVTHSLAEAVFMADRVFVMSPRPGRIIAHVPVQLPRPRVPTMMKDHAFFRIVNEVRDLLYGREEAALPEH
jgi:NitT/TauT family transport system ATP-binding protein